MEEKYTIAEDYTLPSKGLIYDKGVNPNIKLRSMTVREEMKRLAPTNTQYKVLSEIIEGCIVGEKPAIHVYDMCLGDFEYLLHKLRVVTYGPEYKMVTMCSSCGAIEESTINLDALEILDYKEDEFKKLLIVHLPVSNKDVTLNYQTPRMLDNIKLKSEEMKKKTKDSNLDYELLANLEESISLVDDVKLSYVEKDQFINKLPARDMNKIIQSLEKINKMIGLKNEVKYTCKACGEENLTFFRFGPEFFRPSED